MKVLGVGSVLMDILVRLDSERIPEELPLTKGEMTMLSKDLVRDILARYSQGQKIEAGGSSSNTISAYCALGEEGSFMGRIGDDDLSAAFRSSMEKCGVQLHLPSFHTGTSIAVTLITSDGERTFADWLNPECNLEAEDVTPDIFDGVDFLYIEGYQIFNWEYMLKIGDMAKERGIKVAIDMASASVIRAEREHFKEYLDKYVDIVFANEEEAMAMAQTDNILEAIDSLKFRYPVLIVKLGPKGSMIFQNGKQYRADAVQVDKVLDTTGAGDAFAAGYLYGMSKGLSPDVCGYFGSMAATKVIVKIGARADNAVWWKLREEFEESVSKG